VQKSIKVDDAMAMARKIAGRGPDAMRADKNLVNRPSNAGAADRFAAEREITFKLVGSASQVESITVILENRAPVSKVVG